MITAYGPSSIRQWASSLLGKNEPLRPLGGGQLHRAGLGHQLTRREPLRSFTRSGVRS
jgi:hypothetical protein